MLALSWLPVLDVGVIATRAVRSLLRTVRWAQWFMRHGDQHPLRAIGLVAATAVFVLTAVVDMGFVH
jgi:hypothetical protein